MAAPLGILRAGDVNPALVPEFGDGDAFFTRMLRSKFAGADIAFWDVQSGDFPASPHDANAWLITGSKHGVYDPLPWIEPLKSFIRDIRASGKPLVGVCFGHQIMAEAFGGRVEKSAKGWGCGAQAYQVHAAYAGPLQALPEEITLLAMHQDQVIVPPPGATTVMSSEFCEHAALVYDAQTFSVQPHPEFEPDYLRALIVLRTGAGIPHERGQEGVASLSRAHHSETVGARIASLLGCEASAVSA